MTARDEFAKAAMQAMLSQAMDSEDGRLYVNMNYGKLAGEAYSIADAMMRERQRREDEMLREGDT